MISQPNLVEFDSSDSAIVNVASVPQRSPFRYPGGKTWLVPHFRRWIGGLDPKPVTLIEPFCGGGIISLTAVMERLVSDSVMGEIDPQVGSVWRAILEGEAEALARRILRYPLTRERAQEDLARPAKSNLDLAFQTILRNRVQRGGILAPGASLMKEGENGKGIASRWYPATLAKRIREIGRHGDRISFHGIDAFELIARHAERKDAAFFIDPPYTAGGKRAGKRLYGVNQVDHARLFRMACEVRGKVMLTYDEAPEVIELARRHGLRVDRIPMKNTHHAEMRELVITNVAA